MYNSDLYSSWSSNLPSRPGLYGQVYGGQITQLAAETIRASTATRVLACDAAAQAFPRLNKARLDV